MFVNKYLPEINEKQVFAEIRPEINEKQVFAEIRPEIIEKQVFAVNYCQLTLATSTCSSY